jgi:transposase
MLTFSSTLRIFLYTRPVDMRKGFDGLSGIVEQVFDQDVLSGHLFVFVNRRLGSRLRERLKLLYFDRDGLAIWYKLLELGSFEIPRADSEGLEISATQLAMILGGIDLASAKQRRRWRRAG